jgi:hypothetical protein
MSTSNGGAKAIPNDKYWASVETAELPAVIEAKAQAFRERLERDGRLDVWRKSERTYYGLDGEGGWANSVAVTYGGDEGELVLARINHYRSIVQAVIAMVTGARPAFTATAINSDVQSLEAASLARGVVDWAYRTKRVEDLRIEQVERAVVSGEGYLHLRWDVHAGRVVPGATAQRPVYDQRGEPVIDEVEEPMQADPNAPAPPGGMQEPPAVTVTRQVPRMESYERREGDVRPEVLGPLQVVRDLDCREMRYAIVPHRENVWDLAARYPQLRDHLIALRGQEQWALRVWGDESRQKPADDDDTIVVWCLYHPPCDALPTGRYSIVAGPLTLHDEPWKFGDEVPIYDLVPMRQLDTEMGYSPMWDLLCLQELLDATITAMASSADAFGIQNISVPKGADISPEMISRGLQLLEYDHVEGHPTGGKPEALQLLSIPSDHYKLEDIYKRTMETLSGVNSVARGEPQSNLKSGAALALVQSLATHFQSVLQGQVTRNDERVGTGLLKLYQRFSPMPRLAEIVGKRNARSLREFTSEQLQGVQRVHVELMSTNLRGAGLMDLAMQQLTAGAIDLAQFYELLNTGRIEPLLTKVADESPEEIRQIMDENEELSSGRQVPVNDGDRDDIHIKHHKAVTYSPEVRRNQALLKVHTVHVLQHLAAMGAPFAAQALAAAGEEPRAAKPVELMWAIGQEIPPWLMGGPGGAQSTGEGADAGEGPPGPTGTEPPEERAEVMGQPGPSNGPLMPTNPMTGERAPNPQQVQ